MGFATYTNAGGLNIIVQFVHAPLEYVDVGGKVIAEVIAFRKP